jgi:hypothetical protein
MVDNQPPKPPAPPNPVAVWESFIPDLIRAYLDSRMLLAKSMAEDESMEGVHVIIYNISLYLYLFFFIWIMIWLIDPLDSHNNLYDQLTSMSTLIRTQHVYPSMASFLHKDLFLPRLQQYMEYSQKVCLCVCSFTHSFFSETNIFTFHMFYFILFFCIHKIAYDMIISHF